MAILDILIAPDRRLQTRCSPLEAVDDGVRAVLADMLETMYGAPGIGLAAPQVGVLKRLAVLDLAGPGGPPEPLKLVNPEIIWVSDRRATAEEGCLSLPGVSVAVERPEAVRVAFLDENGGEREIEAEGLRARCLQHEIDHLDGVLVVDRLSSVKRSAALRRLRKMKRRGHDPGK